MLIQHLKTLREAAQLQISHLVGAKKDGYEESVIELNKAIAGIDKEIENHNAMSTANDGGGMMLAAKLIAWRDNLLTSERDLLNAERLFADEEITIDCFDLERSRKVINSTVSNIEQMLTTCGFLPEADEDLPF